MNKRFLLLTFVALMFTDEIASQTVQWAVRPTSAQIEGDGQLLKIRKNGKVGLIDHNNRVIIPVQYDSISSFRDGYALAMNARGNQLKIEAVISEGDYELQPLTETVYATRYMWFSDGKMPVSGTGGWGYLGTDGNMVIPCQFQAAYPFSEGFASIMIDDKAYFIDRNMDYLPVEAGYGNLVFASTFSGNEAVVYSGNSYTPKGYVINRRGKIVRSYKVKAADLKINKYDHSVGDKAKYFEEHVGQMELNNSYTVYEENQMYGYKKNGVIVLPAQLEKAEPVRGDYANVRFRGQNGVLRIIDGSVSIEMESRDIEVMGDNVGKGFLKVNLPLTMEDATIRLRMIDEHGHEMPVQANVNMGNNRSYSFQPLSAPANSGISNCKVEVWSDNLILCTQDCSINYLVKEIPVEQVTVEETTIPETTKMKIASLTISPPQASGKRANPKHDFYIKVAVTNSGDERGNATISLYVDGQPVGNKNISVRGHGSSNAIFAISNVKKERYAKVKATLKNGRTSQEANIHFMPFD